MFQRVPFQAVGTLLVVAVACGCGQRPSSLHAAAAPPHPNPARPGELKASLQKELTDFGWQPAAAKAVVDLNADWFFVLQSADPNGLRSQVELLKKIGDHDRLDPFLQDHPEMAGVLAVVPNAEDLAQALSDEGPDGDRLASLFVALAAPEDMIALSEALVADHRVIARLLRHGYFGAELAFLFPRKGDGAAKYHQWLLDEFERLPDAQGNEKTAAFLQIVLLKGRSLRQQVRDDKAFASSWRKLGRVAEEKKWPTEVVLAVLDEPLVWKVLARPDGEKLLAEWGPLPGYLLYGESAYPEELHACIVEALHGGDNDTVKAMFQYRKEPLFPKLLGRKLSRETRRAAMYKLLAAGSDAETLLRKWDGWDDAILADEVGTAPPAGVESWIPLYYDLVVAEKLWQGRDPSAMEWVIAVADPVLMMAPVPGGGELVEIPGKIFTTPLGKGTEEAAEKAGLELLEKEGVEAAEKGLAKEMGRQVAKEFAKKELESEAESWGASLFFRRTQEELGKKVLALDEATTLDVTQPVRFLFKSSGVGRESFKTLAGFVGDQVGVKGANLEARLFMRGDARVYVHVGRFLANMLKDKVADKLSDIDALKPILDPEGALKDALAQAIDAARRAGAPEPTGPTPQELEVWRKNVSAWWLMNAGGLPDLSNGK